jgi:hypothetical protein
MKMQTSGDQRREIAKLYPPSLRAKRSNPSLLSPRYGLLRFARNDVERVVSHRQHDRVRSPDERSDIRDHSHTAPDIAALIRATRAER